MQVIPDRTESSVMLNSAHYLQPLYLVHNSAAVTSVVPCKRSMSVLPDAGRGFSASTSAARPVTTVSCLRHYHTPRSQAHPVTNVQNIHTVSTATTNKATRQS